MTRLLKAIRGWCQLWRWRREWTRQVAMPWPVPPPVGPGEEWTNEDAQRLAAFFGSGSGASALRMLQRLEWDNYAAACNQEQRSREYAAGYASGFRCCAAFLMTLSAERSATAQTAEPAAEDDAAFRARFTS